MMTKTSPTAAASDIARMGIVRSFQISAVFPRLTVRDNVRVALQRPTGTSFYFWQLAQTPFAVGQRVPTSCSLRSASWTSPHCPPCNCPMGASARWKSRPRIALDPELLLLDEPTAGIGQEDVVLISKLIRQLAASRTVLMVEHNLSVVADLSDIITVLTRGRVLAEGHYAEVSQIPACPGGVSWSRSCLNRQRN